LDLKDLGQVRPDFMKQKREQKKICDDLRKDMQELKCLVGCLEACVPQETRKAVALFKRAAGAAVAQQGPVSPREFELDRKLLELRSEVESQMQGVAETVGDGKEYMNQIVRGLERKQELMEGRLHDVRSFLMGQAPTLLALEPPGVLEVDPASDRCSTAASHPRPGSEEQAGRGLEPQRPSERGSTAASTNTNYRASPMPPGWAPVAQSKT